MLRLIVDKPQSLKEFTENNYAQGSFFWNYLLKNKEIKVNGERINQNICVQTGDIVCYYLTKKQEEKPAFYTVYEDENVLVADKESGVNSEAVFSGLARERECYFIHRLDRNTSGLLIFALNKPTESKLLQAFKERKIEKIYRALCFGVPPKKAEVMTAYLKKDAERALVRVFNEPKNGAEKIITEYRLIDKTDEYSRLEICLHTGKTHQIRAHLAHIGCPIVGDMKYGNSAKNKEKGVSRQCLVSKEIRLNLDGDLAYLNEKQWISRFETEI